MDINLNLTLTNQLIVVITIFLLINFLAFAIMLLDKFKSRRNNTRRISEGKLFFMAVVFGSLGVYAGMFVFRHKTRKWYFLLGIPMLMVQNCAFLYLVYIFLSGFGV